MKKLTCKFSTASVQYYFDAGITQLKKIARQKHSIIITDEHIFKHHSKRLKGWNTIILKPGEEYKVQATADALIEQLIALRADRSTTLIGVGGGVVTDLTGYVASVYMRGIPFGFVPTTLLGMVDASIGGKNGIDVGIYKNMVGVIRQPAFILYDMKFLETLPLREWENGFAEIIKHAAIKDARLFRELEQHSIKKYQSSSKAIGNLVRRNALIKTKVVQQDEFEKGERRLLNFGHTLAHALENQYALPHGRAVAIGMTYASVISEKITGFKEAARVASLLLKYDLPTFTDFDKLQVFDVLAMDKKREKKEINYVLLEKIGKGVVRSISLQQLKNLIKEL
jgi:3-dehydroquinate synthase